MSPSHSAKNVCLYTERNLIPSFFQLLQKGFMVKVGASCSVKSFLCQQLGLSPEYVEKRIQTIFLDGKPVDDLNSTTIKHGSTLALSAAMPGLVGAILRRGGSYAPMRSRISHREGTNSQCLQEGVISLKLFNILLKDLGPTLLEKGVWIPGKELGNFLKSQSHDLEAGCRAAKVDGEKMDLDKLSGIEWPDGKVFLQVRAG